MSACQRVIVLSLTILETTKTDEIGNAGKAKFYRSQFWRLQKHVTEEAILKYSFIAHNFGDYKNLK